MVRSLLLTLAAASVTSAHFELSWPPAAEGNHDSQGTGPCGGAMVDVAEDSTEVQVDRFAVSVYTGHSAGSWYFRATTDTQEPYNWTTIVPVVETTGSGDFCLQDMRAPADFAGQGGILQVIDSSVHGSLYACAPVNFVTGSNSTTGPSCMNNTGFAATWSSETASGDEAPSGTTEESTGSSGAPSSTSNGAASIATGVGSVVGLGLVAAALAL